MRAMLVASIQIRRSRNTFLLVVLDEDTDRFAVEGPMADDQPWVSEILRAQRAGRRITCWAVDAGSQLNSPEAARLSGLTRWPQGSIVAPETKCPRISSQS